MTHSEVNPHDDEGHSPLGRTMVTVAASLVGIAVIAGILVAVSVATRSDRTVEQNVPIEDAGQVRVIVNGADVVVRSSQSSDIKISADITEGLFSTDFEVGRDGDTLIVTSSCQSWLVPGCGADVTLEVPRDLPLNLNTGSGDLKADDLIAVEADLTTTSGRIDASFAEPPYGVKAHSTSGDIAVQIPPGDIKYSVNADSASGSQNVDLADEPEGSGFVTVLSDSGDIEVNSD